jgi:hypothetical protein
VYAADSFQSLLGNAPVGPVQEGVKTPLPYIFWGGDLPTHMALSQKYKLTAGDDFIQQCRDYLAGKTPFLRCTMHMLGLASETLNKDPRTKPVVFLQLTWSAGDHIVARANIKSLNDLKGKKIALQQCGPHVGLLGESLEAAGLTWDDITVVWCKDLSGTPDSPAEKFRKDSTIDACCVISPDMIGLCSGLDQKGSGAEGTVKGAHVVNSTASMSHCIPDVYACRKDYYDTHQSEIEQFDVAYFKATEELLAAKAEYNNGKGKSARYTELLKMAQAIWGAKSLPTLENDAHGLICDANFARIPGNESFFADQNNQNGFDAKMKVGLDLAVRLGYAKERMGFEVAKLDYKKISQLVGVSYVPPVFATGRIKGEVTDFSKDLEDDTILSFTIQFDPEQTQFSVERYGAEFKRVIKAASTFGNAVVMIRGFSDPTLTLQHFFWAARAKGLITGDPGNYRFRDQPLNLADTNMVLQAIQQENLAGQRRQDRSGNVVPIPDPKMTAQSAMTLSQSRAESVKAVIEKLAKDSKVSLDLSQIRPQGVGIAEPIIARPTSIAEATKNMRVEFRVVKVAAEAIKESDFNFDK